MKKRLTMTIVVEGHGLLYDEVVEQIKILKDQFEIEYSEEGPYGFESEIKQSATIIEEDIESVC